MKHIIRSKLLTVKELREAIKGGFFAETIKYYEVEWMNKLNFTIKDGCFRKLQAYSFKGKTIFKEVEWMKIDDLDLRHYLNEALRQVLDKEGVKVNDELSYDVSLEHDYFLLLDAFKNHLEMIIKLNEVEEW